MVCCSVPLPNPVYLLADRWLKPSIMCYLLIEAGYFIGIEKSQV